MEQTTKSYASVAREVIRKFSTGRSLQQLLHQLC